MATAAPEEGREPPGLAPRFWRSDATGDMAGCGGGCLKQEREPPVMYVLALPATALPAAVCRLEAAVPRKARSSLPRAVPSGWWAYRAAPVVVPPPLAMNPVPIEEEEAQAPTPSSFRPPRQRVDSSPTPSPPAKRTRRCVRCDAAETPQWRSGPIGRSTLCNACGVRYRAVAALLGHRPAPPAATAPLPSPPESPIWEPHHEPPSPPDIYLVRKPPPKKAKSKSKKKKRKRAAPSPVPAPAPWRNKRKHSCAHCGSSETPQWREGPAGRGTLCNACGVRYRQGRLLPEYRPKGSPTFSPSEHAFNHRKVLKLHRHHKDKPPSPPVHQPVADEQPVDDVPQEQPVVAVPSAGGSDLTEGPSSLDSLLLDGPSAPLIVDSNDFLIS